MSLQTTAVCFELTSLTTLLWKQVTNLLSHYLYITPLVFICNSLNFLWYVQLSFPLAAHSVTNSRCFASLNCRLLSIWIFAGRKMSFYFTREELGRLSFSSASHYKFSSSNETDNFLDHTEMWITLSYWPLWLHTFGVFSVPQTMGISFNCISH